MINLGLNGISGYSEGGSQSDGYSYGTSSKYAYNQSQAMEDAWGDSSSWNLGEGWSNANSYSQDNSYNKTFGREASAQDIQNAREANQIQRDLWSEQAAYNSKEAARNREYQAYMSNTAYQRAIKDLLAAGLNPILAVGNMGASTPVGSMATSGLASSHKANAYAQSEGRSSGYSTSASNSYNYNKGSSQSHNESHSRSSSKGETWEESRNGSENHSTSWERSETTNNIKEVAQMGTELIDNAIGKLKDLLPENSGKSIMDSIKGGVDRFKNNWNNFKDAWKENKNKQMEFWQKGKSKGYRNI